MGRAVRATGYITAELLEMGLTRPERDPGRDDPVIYAGDRLVAGASPQAWPPMTEVVCPIMVDLTLSPGDRSAAIDALMVALRDDTIRASPRGRSGKLGSPMRAPEELLDS